MTLLAIIGPLIMFFVFLVVSPFAYQSTKSKTILFSFSLFASLFLSIALMGLYEMGYRNGQIHILEGNKPTVEKVEKTETEWVRIKED